MLVLSFDQARILFQYADLNNRLRRLAEEFRHPGHRGVDRRINEFALEGLDYAQAISPFLTGTLRAAHHVVQRADDDVYEATITLAPLVNPLLGGIASEYGPRVHDYDPWMDETAAYLTDQLPELSKTIALHYIEIMRGRP